MKKLLIATELFRPSPGGIEGYLTGICRQWDRKKICVNVLSDSSSGKKTGDFTEFDSGESYDIRRTEIPGFTLQYFKKSKEFIRSMSDLIHEFVPDHVLAGNLSPSLFHYTQTARSCAVPYSLILNGEDLNAASGLMRYKYREMIRQARFVFTFSAYLKNKILNQLSNDCPAHKIEILPPACEFGNIPASPGALYRELKKKARSRIIVLCMGPLVSWKGFDRALEALFHLKDLEDRLHLIVTGTGRDLPYLRAVALQKEISHMVTFTGFLPDRDLYDLLFLSHIFLQPGQSGASAGQGLSVSLMEAAYFGMPAVVGGGGLEELIEEGVTGFTADPDQPIDIALRLRSLILNDKIRKKAGHSAKRHAELHFSMKQAASFLNKRI